MDSMADKSENPEIDAVLDSICDHGALIPSRPIAYNREFVELGASAIGALMLSQAIYWSQRTSNGSEWFYKTQQEWWEEIGLTRCEQKTARTRLLKLGFLEEERRGIPAKLYFRVNKRNIARAIIARSMPSDDRATDPAVASMRKSSILDSSPVATSMRKSSKQECANPANRNAQIQQSITENTTETTTEITQTHVAPEAKATVAAQGDLIPVGHDEPVLPRIDIPDDMPGPKDQNAKTFRPWANYAMAYRHRYGAWPIWNAKVAGQFTQLVNRVGIDLAPAVAAWYVRANNQYYVTKSHPTGLLLTDCEVLAVQCQTGRQVTASKARQTDRSQSNLSAIEEAKAMMRAKREREGGEC